MVILSIFYMLTVLCMKEKNNSRNKFILISPDFPPPFIGGSLVYIHNLITHSNLKFDILTNRINRKNDFNIQYYESKYIVSSNSPKLYRLVIMYIYLWNFIRDSCSSILTGSDISPFPYRAISCSLN